MRLTTPPRGGTNSRPAVGARGLFGTLACLLLLTGCFLPSNFNATMQIAPDGRFSFRYEGYLTQLQFLQKLGNDELDPDEIEEYVDIFANSLKRDSGFKEVTYISQAKYRVRYERRDSLARMKQFSFPERRAKLVAIKINEQGYIEVFGDKLPNNIKQELKNKGFKLWGNLKIWTSADVVDNNATTVTNQGSTTQYEWDIRSMDHGPPKMRIVPNS